jgi:NodT family efflux transporter outer membrane factor (OMF) lipoprotein
MVAMISRLPRLVLGIAFLGLAACAPDLGPLPFFKAPETYASQKSFTAAQSNWPDADWWKAYGDDQLNGLIAEGVANAPDLKLAEARLRQADATAQQSGASLLPQLTANGSASETRASLNQGFPAAFQSFLPHGFHDQGRITGDLSYDPDFFGKNRAAFAAATSEADAVRVDLASSRLSLSSAIASAYANLVQQTADRLAAIDAINVRKQSEDQLRQRFAQQLENSGAVSEAESRTHAAEADLDRIDGQIALTRNQLAALVGKGPDRGLDIPLPANPKLQALGIPANLSADLIGRRPDIAATRLRAMAASKRIDVAHADFYPNINLTGYAGFQSLGLNTLITSSSLIGQLGPAISLPIFDGGRIEGAYRGARAEYDEAVATYDQTLTTALREVADALANQRELANELGHSRAALLASEDAYRVAQQRYGAGLSRYLEVLTSEDTLVTQRKTVADLQARAFVQDVALVRALGGGFHLDNTNVAQAAKEQ